MEQSDKARKIPLPSFKWPPPPPPSESPPPPPNEQLASEGVRRSNGVETKHGEKKSEKGNERKIIGPRPIRENRKDESRGTKRVPIVVGEEHGELSSNIRSRPEEELEEYDFPKKKSTSRITNNSNSTRSINSTKQSELSEFSELSEDSSEFEEKFGENYAGFGQKDSGESVPKRFVRDTGSGGGVSDEQRKIARTKERTNNANRKVVSTERRIKETRREIATTEREVEKTKNEIAEIERELKDTEKQLLGEYDPERGIKIRR